MVLSCRRLACAVPTENTQTEKGWASRQSLTVGPSGSASYSFAITSFAADGDILGANDSVNGNWVYAYDQFNRLVCANLSNGTCASPTNGTATYTYNYDRFGNRWHQNGTNSSSVSFTGNNNRMDTYSYDAAGDLLNDGVHSYAYDGYGEIASVDGGNTANYYYDAEGRRVRKNLAGSITDYIYNLEGQEIAEFDGSGNWLRGEAFVSGRYHIATYTNGATYFDHADWLGTERGRTPVAGGAPCETISSLPFGDGEVDTGSCEGTSTRHFTGKERDLESNLDNFGARYNSSAFGRFMSPDWSSHPEDVPYADFSNPQTLNLYSYVLNNPTTRLDPDGHVVGQNSTCSGVCDGAADDPGQATDQKPSNGQPSAQNLAQGAGQGQSAGQHQNGDVAKANHYLSRSKEMRLVEKAFKSGHFHLVIIHDGNDRYDPETRTVYWDPHSALQTTQGGHQTPALGLGHEMAHATGNRHDTAVLSNTPDARYDTKEERRVILNYENPAARELGESTRSNHGGTPYNVVCPTCQ
jgi:RHS repeat-associated protein